MKTLIRNATLINENKRFVSDVLIVNDRIEKIDSQINLAREQSFNEINAEGLFLIPGMIDDQVHFREPGLTHKGTIRSESRAAVAGGITSFMDMPNTVPNTLTIPLLEEKYSLAAQNSLANYSFFMGVTKNNLNEALLTNPETVCGITDDGLYFDNEEGMLANFPDFLEELFSKTNTLVALHSENDAMIRKNLLHYSNLYGDDIPISLHAKIRSEEACVTATKKVLEVAKKHSSRVHFFHLSTGAEAQLFDEFTPISNKRITSEVCIHHLWFSEEDYNQLGSKIKWNPSIKTESDKRALLQALLDGKIDIVATDHAPHTPEEKSGNYFQAASGGPLVQHALVTMFEMYHQGKISLEKIVEKTSHHVAEIYKIIDRGYLREGYFADLVLVDLNNEWKVTANNILYKSGWSPFENKTFNSKVIQTFVNGKSVFNKGVFDESPYGRRLQFQRIR